jgi:hypothetical protein
MFTWHPSYRVTLSMHAKPGASAPRPGRTPWTIRAPTAALDLAHEPRRGEGRCKRTNLRLVNPAEMQLLLMAWVDSLPLQH